MNNIFKKSFFIKGWQLIVIAILTFFVSIYITLCIYSMLGLHYIIVTNG